MSIGGVIWVVLTLAGLLILARAAFLANERSDLRIDVKYCMIREDTRLGRILLALHGHRMDKHTREALTVWLAERGEE